MQLNFFMLKKGYFEHLAKCFDPVELTKYFLNLVTFPGPTHPGNKASTNHTHFRLPPIPSNIYTHTHTHSPP